MLFTELEKIHVPAAQITHKEDWLTPSVPIGIQELFQKYNGKYDLRKKKMFYPPQTYLILSNKTSQLNHGIASPMSKT